MEKFKEKPVIIEAFQYDGDMVDQWGEPYVPKLAIRALEDDGTMYYKGQGELYIKSIEGDTHVSIGDYIIRGIQGELYSCKPDIFKKTYEPYYSNSIFHLRYGLY